MKCWLCDEPAVAEIITTAHGPVPSADVNHACATHTSRQCGQAGDYAVTFGYQVIQVIRPVPEESS